ncbi:MAG: type I methionyl aminopeptidase [Anaerolineae bacterium]|nr:type I methionyl aminopeptidase [Anaerolineae bacterium]
MQKRNGLSWLRSTKRNADETARSVAQAYGRRPKQTHKREVIIKNETQITGIRKSCHLTRDILDAMTDRIAPGITTEQINTWVHEMTLAHGATPAPLNYRGFPKSVCTSINEVVCHGIPSPSRILQEGDILNIDVTSILDGYYGDSSRMFLIGEVDPEARKLVQVTRECMELGIAQVKPGNRLGDIGHAIQQHAESHGYSVVRAFVGHGTGINFHEAPDVLHYGVPHTGVELVPGMVFTIEPMINVGDYQVRTLSDGWTAVTADGSLSAQWEHTVLVTEDGVEVLTA